MGLIYPLVVYSFLDAENFKEVCHASLSRCHPQQCVPGVFGCRHGGESICALRLADQPQMPVEIYLPQVVEVVESVDSWLMDDYVDALREKVCAFCENSESGFCALRLQADCAPDRYFMLVADAIKEVDARLNAEAGTVGIP